MNPHLPAEAFERLTHRLSAIDAEIRSIRATLFQLTTQQTSDREGAEPQFRSAEDFVRQPD